MNKNKYRIVFFITNLNSGGIENYLYRFLRSYSQEFESVVFCKGGSYGELELQYRSLRNVTIVKDRIDHMSYLYCQKLYTFFSKGDFHAVCDFTGNFAGVVLREAEKAGIKNRIAFYRGSKNRFRETKLKLFYNNLVKNLVKLHATVILSNSQAAFDYFFTTFDSRFKVIYNGIDSQEFDFNEEKGEIRRSLGIPEDVFLVGNTGRLHFSKNHDTILKVAEEICIKRNDIHFVLCGKGTDGLAKNINSGILEKIHLLGYRSDIPRILKACDLFIFPSITEGQPNSLIEAMLCGLPILASNISPIKETVPRCFEKYLLHPNDVDGYVDAIEKYIANDYYKMKEINLREWALNTFNPQLNFKEFFNVLTS